MSNKPLANPNAFTGQSPPWSLTQLDANFTAIQNTINDTLTYSNYFVDQSGVVNSVIVSIPATLAVALTAGTILHVKIANSNTGATTITVNSLVAQSILNPGNLALNPGQLVAGAIAILAYDGTRFQLLGLANNQTFAGGSADVYNVLYTRNAAYSGGTPGFVNATFRTTTNVTGTGATAYEWSIVGVLNNSATGGQNVAIYGQGNRQTTTTGPTWAGVMEARETVAINDPTTGLVGLEVDNRSNGTDANNNRVGIDVVAARYTASGTTQMGFGVRVQNSGDANVTVKTAFSVNTTATVGFDTSASTITQAAFKMAQNQAIAFDSSATNQLSYDGTGLALKVSSSLIARINSATGILNIGPGAPGTAAAIISSVTGATGTVQASYQASDTLSGTLVSGGVAVANTITASTAVSNYRGVEIKDATLNAGATITNQSAFFANDMTRGSSLIAGANLNVASGANKYNVYAAGTAQNFMQGPLGINGVPAPSRVTGFGTPTGTGVINNFSGAAATLAQCSQAIAQLITDLKNFGLYGA